MENKPEANETADGPLPRVERAAGGDSFVIQGGVGPGANIGRGFVQADLIAGGDITMQPGAGEAAATEQHVKFSALLTDLQELIKQAKEAGEMDLGKAEEVLKTLSEAAEIAGEPSKKPPKNIILEKLSFVSDMLDSAVDMITPDSGPAKILLRAMPLAALLIKIAIRIF